MEPEQYSNKNNSGITKRLITLLLFTFLVFPEYEHAEPIPGLPSKEFDNTDRDPESSRAPGNADVAEWELEADKEYFKLQEEQQKQLRNKFNSDEEYVAYLNQQLQSRNENYPYWERNAEIALRNGRSAFLDELTYQKQKTTGTDIKALQNGWNLAYGSGENLNLEQRLNEMQTGWAGEYAEDVALGLNEFAGGQTAIEEGYLDIQRLIQNQNADYQIGLSNIQYYENEIRNKVAGAVLEMETNLQNMTMFQAEVCDENNENCRLELNDAGQELQGLLAGLKENLINKAPLTSLAQQMVDYLRIQHEQAAKMAQDWERQARKTESLENINSVPTGLLGGYKEAELVNAIRSKYLGGDDEAIKAYLNSCLGTGLMVESVSAADVCGQGWHEPFFLTVSVAGANECYSAVGEGAFSYWAVGIGGWAGIPLFTPPTLFAEDEIVFKGSYVIYDANADTNATTWSRHTFELDGFLKNWNDMLPDLTNWEAQSTAYQASFEEWKLNAGKTLERAALTYETEMTALVNERTKWLSQMENGYHEGRHEWSVIRKELEKSQTAIRKELEAADLHGIDLEKELDRRSLAAIKKLSPPARPGTQTSALKSALRAYNKFTDIKNAAMETTERVDNSAMEKILAQFNNSLSGAMNLAVMETLNLEAQEARAGMVDYMSEILSKELKQSVTQNLHYGEVLNRARNNLKITDEMFADGFDSLSSENTKRLEAEIARIFKDEYGNDEGFSVRKKANGNIEITRKVPTGRAIQLAGTDGTKPEHYAPELRSETTVVLGPAAQKLIDTGSIFENWDLDEIKRAAAKSRNEYNIRAGKDIEKTLNKTLQEQGQILNDRANIYNDNRAGRMAAATTFKSIVESMFTGGQDFKSAATNYFEGQVRGQIAAAVAEATGLPSEFISGLMGGQKPHEAVISMAENAAWQNFERATGIEGISTLLKTAMSNEQARKAERKSRELRLEDFATLGTTYALRNQQYSGGLQTMLSMGSLATGFLYTPLQNAYQNSLTKQGGAAFSGLVNESLNGFTGNISTLTTALATGRALSRSQIQSLTGLPSNYLNRLPGKLKPASERRDIYERLGTRNLGRWVDRVVDEGTKFGQNLASGAYFANTIGGEFGDTLKRRNSVDFATAEDLTNVIFNPLDYIIKPMYAAVGMERTYDNFWAPYKKFTRKGKEQFRDTLAKNPALLDVTAFAAANATGCLQCYYGYAWQKGWNQGGTKGAVAEVGTILLKGVGALALGPAAAQGTSASVATLEALFTSLDAGVGYSYENGWDMKVGLADPTGKLSGGLTFSDENGVGVYANISATESKHGASLGFAYNEGGGLSLNAGGKRGGFNAGISYSATNGFGLTGGYTDDLGVFSDSLKNSTGGLSFSLSQRGGWSAGATYSPEANRDSRYIKERGTSLGLSYYNRPGQGGGLSMSGAIQGLSIEHDLTTGQSTIGDFSQLIRSQIAAQREKDLLTKRLAEIQQKIGVVLTAEEWKQMSTEAREQLLQEVKDSSANSPEGSEGESYNTNGGLLGDLLNAAKDGLVGMFGGISDKWGYVDAQGKYHTRVCFVAGTLIATGDGFRPIEEVRAGDVVLSWNEKSGEIGFNKVTQTFVRTADLIYGVTYEDGTFIETTWNHRFYIKGRGWILAKDLREGDLSLTASSIRGESRALKITNIIQDERDETVYNFEVSRDHTYFVSEAGVLVHNDSYLTNPSKFNIAKRYLRGISDEEIKEVYDGENAVKNFRLGQIYGEYFWKVEAYVVIEEFTKSGLPQNDESFFEFAFEHIRKQLKQNTGLTDPVEIEAFIAGARDYYLIEMRGKPGLFAAVNAGIALGLGGNKHGGPRTKKPPKSTSKPTAKPGQDAKPGKKPPNPYGIHGKPDHQRTVQKLKEMAKKEFPNGDIKASKSIKDGLGKDRRPDIIVRDPKTKKILKVYEAARTNKDGTFIAREQLKMKEYQRKGIPYHFEPVK